jgi:hypothetical protein
MITLTNGLHLSRLEPDIWFGHTCRTDIRVLLKISMAIDAHAWIDRKMAA